MSNQEILRIRFYCDKTGNGLGEYIDDIIIGIRQNSIVGIIEDTLNQKYHMIIYVSQNEINRFKSMANQLSENELKECRL